MIYKKLSLSVLLFAAGFLTASAQKSPQDMDRFIDVLMNKMTLEEKIGQLNLPVTGEITTGQAKSSDIAAKIKKGEVGGLFNLKGVEKIREVQKQAVEDSRLGIPLLFGMDVIHGYETMFPIPLGLSCTWDMTAIEESARIAAVEASADGISWTFSPMVDISRDPRWGRVSEGSGEDPFLGAMIAEAMVRGYQGKNMERNDEIMACVKHFALYGAGEGGRDYNTVDMSRQRMFNEYMLPYEAAVEAGVGSVMASFNEVDGVPATANKWPHINPKVLCISLVAAMYAPSPRSSLIFSKRNLNIEFSASITVCARIHRTTKVVLSIPSTTIPMAMVRPKKISALMTKYL